MLSLPSPPAPGQSAVRGSLPPGDIAGKWKGLALNGKALPNDQEGRAPTTLPVPGPLPWELRPPDVMPPSAPATVGHPPPFARHPAPAAGGEYGRTPPAP